MAVNELLKRFSFATFTVLELNVDYFVGGHVYQRHRLALGIAGIEDRYRQ